MVNITRFFAKLHEGKSSANDKNGNVSPIAVPSVDGRASDASRPTAVQLSPPTVPPREVPQQQLRPHRDRFLLVKMFRVVADENMMVDYKGIINMARMRSLYAINVFGGERFVDYIGEIQFLTEEEQAAISRGAFVRVSPPPLLGTTSAQGTTIPYSTPPSATAQISPKDGVPPPAYIRSPCGTGRPSADMKAQDKRSTNARLEIAQVEYDKVEKRRVALQTAKLIERLRPYAEAEYAGDEDDPATVAFINMIKCEAERLKKEMFGVKLLHLIGNVYKMKGSWIVRAFDVNSFWYSFGMKRKEVATIKWSVHKSRRHMSVARRSLKHMIKLDAKGKLSAEKHRALEEDVAYKIMYAAWQHSKANIIQRLITVATNVFYQGNQSGIILYKRAEALAIMGDIFLSVAGV